MSNLSDAERVAELTNEERYMLVSKERYEPLTDDRIEELILSCEGSLGEHCEDDVHRLAIMAVNYRTELASVTARLAAATSYRYQFDKGRLTVNQIYGYGDLHWAGHVHDYLDSSIQPVYFRTLEEAFLWLDHKLAAAVSAGWMKPLGENAQEPPHER